MVKFTFANSTPAIGAGTLAFVWLCMLIDAFSNSLWGGFWTFVISVPIFGSLVALLSLDAVIALEIPWEPANDWYHFCHESTQGALLLTIFTLPWAFAVISAAMMGVFDLWFGGGMFTTPLNWLAKIPIIGQVVASLLGLFFIGVFVGLICYVGYTGISSVIRLIRTPRSGYVRNGVLLDQHQQGPDDGDVEGGEFGGWESNRG
jgi:hypothetical protein